MKIYTELVLSLKHSILLIASVFISFSVIAQEKDTIEVENLPLVLILSNDFNGIEIGGGVGDFRYKNVSYIQQTNFTTPSFHINYSKTQGIDKMFAINYKFGISHLRGKIDYTIANPDSLQYFIGDFNYTNFKVAILPEFHMELYPVSPFIKLGPHLSYNLFSQVKGTNQNGSFEQSGFYNSNGISWGQTLEAGFRKSLGDYKRLTASAEVSFFWLNPTYYVYYGLNLGIDFRKKLKD